MPNTNAARTGWCRGFTEAGIECCANSCPSWS
jgi:hypothetical protein